MAILVFRSAARHDVAEVAAYIFKESQSSAIASAFVERILGHCIRLASLPGELGRARPELGDYRSTPFENYVIFFRYSDEGGPRSHLYVVRILHRARDVAKAFAQPDERS